MYEAEFLICKECGNLLEVCSDPTRPWYPQRTTCYASAVTAVKQREYDAKHPGEPPLGALGPHDGVRLWSSTENLTPDDHFV